MKINIKDVFEREEKDVHIHTNDRLDIDEIFAEAGAVAEEHEPADDMGEEPPETEEQLESEELPEPEEVTEPEEQPEPEEASGSGEQLREQAGQEEETETAAEAQETEEPPETEEQLESEELPEPEESPEPEEQSKSEEPLEPEERVEPEEETEAADAGHENSEETVTSEADETDSKSGPPFYKRYMTQGAIAASFVALLAVVVVYTTMIPREVYATINGEEFTFNSKAHTVEGFLEEEQIDFGDSDYISTPLTTFIYDGIELDIQHATDFKVTADGKTRSYESLANTVGEALDDAGIKLDEDDIVTPQKDELLTSDLEIVVQRVDVKVEVVEEAVPFETVEKDDSSLDEGTSKVVTEGVEGKDQVTYSVTYVDGKETSRKETARTTLTAAVDKVIANGTRINYNGQTYSRKLVVKAYAYTGGGRTAMGTRARVGEIAVDPSVIPLGTNVYIEGVGARRAEDTGGNIKGNTIDIYMNTESECRSWGVRYVTIYIQ